MTWEIKRYTKEWKDLQKKMDKVERLLDGEIGMNVVVKFFGENLEDDKVLDEIEAYAKEELEKRVDMAGIEIFVNPMVKKGSKMPSLISFSVKPSKLHN